MYFNGFGACDYRRGMDWILDLLTTCVHNSGATLYSSLTHTD
jgi:hypothetical protein